MSAAPDTAVTRIRFPALYQKQHAAFYCDERISVTEATTKAGKSVGGLVWIQTEALNATTPDSSLWVEPVYALARVMFDRVIRMWTRMDPRRETGWSFNRSELFFQLPNTGRIYFAGADRPDLIYGRDYARAVIDEASRCKEEVWPAVRSTTTHTRGPIRLIGNVKGRKNWAYRLGQLAQGGEPDMAYHRITAQDAVDAGVLDAEEITAARRVLPESVFRELYLAEPSDDGGNPFGLDAIARCATLQELAPGPAVAWGWDLAKSVDWCVGVALNRYGRQCAFERFQLPWAETLQRIKTLSGHVPGAVDSTGVGDPIAEELEKSTALRGVKFTATSKQQLMEGVAVALQTGAIQVLAEGPMRTELDAFEYQYTRTGVRYGAPSGLHDDCVCGLALAVSAFNAVPLIFDPAPHELPADFDAEERTWDMELARW